MPARMNHPAFALVEAMPDLQAVGDAVAADGLPSTTIELVNLRLRASQINGCSVCIDGPRRCLGRSRSPLRRKGHRRARPRHRQHQRLERLNVATGQVAAGDWTAT